MNRHKDFRKQREGNYNAKNVVYQVMQAINGLPIGELEKMAESATMPFRADLFRAMITYKKERDKTYFTRDFK
ncbi:hypothetical protein NOL04_06570 [Streptococcus suis]|nr:hypothetical protein [Streptococcus suis]HEM2769586.1 hypothetical protein [Streptococcus suis]